MIKLRKAFIVGIKGKKLNTNEIKFLKKYKPWGIILFSRNIYTQKQTKLLTKSIRKIFKDDCYPILIDEEGGRVSRLNRLIDTSMFSAKYFGELYFKNRDKFYLYYNVYIKQISYLLNSLGINLNTVPVLDIFRKSSHKIIGDRSFSSNKKIVSKIGDIKGLKIRAPSPSNIPQVKSWGAAAVYMPVTKIYNSLQTGVLDGVYISPGALYKPWRLSEPGEYVSAGMNSPTSLTYVFMNKKVFDGLSSAHKAAIDKHSGASYSMFAANFWGKIDAGQLATAKNEQKGVKFIQLSKSAVADFNAATARSVDQFLAKKEKSGIPARAIYKAASQ